MFEIDLLNRAGVAAPDGRPIFAYSCADAERSRLGADLRLRLELNPQHPVTARRFVLWASEEIRTQLPPGGLTWTWLFGRLERAPDGTLGRDLTVEGFEWWRRPIRRSDDGDLSRLLRGDAEIEQIRPALRLSGIRLPDESVASV